MAVISENEQRLILLAELIDVLPREKQEQIGSLVADIALASYLEGKKSHTDNWYKSNEPPSINIYPKDKEK